MSNSETAADSEFEPDPIFVTGLREGRWILLMWTGCFAWTMVASLTLGYSDDVNPETFPTVLGLPAWVAWGIALPWSVANVLTIWFVLTQMEDADLESDPMPAPGAIFSDDKPPMSAQSTGE